MGGKYPLVGKNESWDYQMGWVNENRVTQRHPINQLFMNGSVKQKFGCPVARQKYRFSKIA